MMSIIHKKRYNTLGNIRKGVNGFLMKPGTEKIYAKRNDSQKKFIFVLI